MINKFNLIFVTFFGIGKIKIIPGTFGSLVITILLFCFLHILFIPLNIILLVLVIIFLYSFYAINSYTKNLTNKDPKEVVIDEVIGQSIPLYLYEISHNTIKDFTDAIIFYFIIFLLFRFFDIIKPFPVSYFDKNFKNSFGVIFDDVFAGLYVVLILIFYMMGRNYLF
ncbi:MAG: phosphatidylglycerophosphatase A [Candidatus Pelagibacter bacterium]|jgi:phosphatidylglycerophosphatase A|nr:phosphatidylglycerophosphatase A [Candidatus Pelagibacter bacterium]